jgi:hypothetical protein
MSNSCSDLFFGAIYKLVQLFLFVLHFIRFVLTITEYITVIKNTNDKSLSKYS